VFSPSSLRAAADAGLPRLAALGIDRGRELVALVDQIEDGREVALQSGHAFVEFDDFGATYS
jgi:hypothetical protein